jgi:hypothetical protein
VCEKLIVRCEVQTDFCLRFRTGVLNFLMVSNLMKFNNFKIPKTFFCSYTHIQKQKLGSLADRSQLHNVADNVACKQIHKNSVFYSRIFIIFRRVRKISKSDYYLCHVRLSACNISAPTGRILMKLC